MLPSKRGWPSMKVARAVKWLVPAPLKRAIKKSEFGLELLRLLRRYGLENYGLENFFPLLRRLGFAPKHIVDVGANRSNWTRIAFKYFPDAVYTLVEPQDHLKFYTQGLIAQGCKLNWINAGCGDFSGTLPLFVSYRDDSSTFVLTNWNRNSTKSQRITVPMITLNKRNKPSKPSSMKRCCRRQIQVLDFSVWGIIALVPAPSLDDRTIWARKTYVVKRCVTIWCVSTL